MIIYSLSAREESNSKLRELKEIQSNISFMIFWLRLFNNFLLSSGQTRIKCSVCAFGRYFANYTISIAVFWVAEGRNQCYINQLTFTSLKTSLQVVSRHHSLLSLVFWNMGNALIDLRQSGRRFIPLFSSIGLL